MSNRKNLKILSEMLGMMMGGFILFNIAFILAFGVHTLVSITFIRQIVPWHYGYIFIIGVLSWFVLKRNLNPFLKATYLTLPLMVGLVEIGLNFYSHPIWVAVISLIFMSGALFLIIKKKLPWQFYFSVFYVSILGIVIMVFNIQI